MPAISRDRWKALEPLLDEALELTPEELAPWLERLTQSAPDMAAELGALLTGDTSADLDGFLSQPLDLTLAGLEVGAYTLETPLGHGGMGSVWLARRTDGRFEGRAAVKLLNRSLIGASGEDRFRREGSMLARLTHPGIARLLDAGVSAGGQPYLVLEYIDGRRLDVHASEHQLSRDDRLRLFLQVLEAVGHAHANLVVHRDLKPSNILVTADGRVKLLDFGIATLLADVPGGLASRADGRAFTPQFAAPEQVRDEPITTATDVYSLGVILYLLLTGRHPTTHDAHTADEVIRNLLEAEPAPLTPRDLGDVVHRALRKKPVDRYQTVDALAEDLERFLRHEPVGESRRALPYRVRKFAQRNLGAVAATAVLGFVLIGATAFSVSQMHEARRQRDAARAAERRADAEAEFASMLVSQVGAQPMTMREILDRARTGLQRQYAADPGFMTSALIQLSSHYSELGDNTIRAELLARAESIAAAAHDSVRLVEVRCNAADNLRTQGQYDDADRTLLAADTLLGRWPDPGVEAVCQLSRASLENERGHPDKSAPAIHRAIAIRDSLGQTRDMFYAGLLSDLGYTLDRQNRSREAIVVRERAVALLDAIGRSETSSSAVILHNLALTYSRMGETERAEAMLHDALQRMSRSDASGRLPTQFLIHYAHVALYQGHADSAAKYFAILAGQAVADHNTYWEGRALFGLAQAQLVVGQRREASRAIERFRAIANNPDLVRTDDQVVNANTLDALTALSAGDTTTGHALVERTLSAYGYFKGKRSATLHSTLMLASRTAIALHRPDSAIAFARAARETATRDSLSDTRSARVGEARLLEALAERQLGKFDSARADASRALVALRAGAGDQNPRTLEAERLVSALR